MACWRALDDDGDLLAATYGRAGVRTTAFRHPVGGWLVYSPGAMSHEALDEFVDKSQGGDVRWLVAPNHFHNLGLARWSERFPRAAVLADPVAHPRLRKRCPTVACFGDATLLPAHPSCRVLRVPGAKQGETWLSLEASVGRTWLVCDAVLNVVDLPPWPERLFSLMLGRGLRLNPLFWRLFVPDRAGARAWLDGEVGRQRPTMLVPCHGEVIRGDDLARQLAKLAAGASM